MILLTASLLPGRGTGRDAQRLDLRGAVLATVGLTSLVYGISQADPRGWSDPVTLAAPAGGAAVLCLFLLAEARPARSPLLPLRLFGSRSVSAGNGVIALVGAAFIPMWYFLSLSMQNVLHYSALRTGVAYIPHTTMIVVGSRLAPRLMKLIGHRTLIMSGAAVSAAGFLWQSRLAPDSGYPAGILGPALLMCLGLGLLMTPVTAAVTSGVAASDAGIASGLMNATRQVGGSLGLAVLATVAGDAANAAGPARAYGHAFEVIAGILIAVILLAGALPAGRPDAAAEHEPESCAAE